ncbi:PREDICTED: basic proline-rich protein-like, partial [Corvus brachyrhynchos]|uniref:basic proline-rich protein-like n=1 Tax=Corvus brachyrhynchos TaxID=85066 RepID=UPI00081633C1
RGFRPGRAREERRRGVGAGSAPGARPGARGSARLREQIGRGGTRVSLSLSLSPGDPRERAGDGREEPSPPPSATPSPPSATPSPPSAPCNPPGATPSPPSATPSPPSAPCNPPGATPSPPSATPSPPSATPSPPSATPSPPGATPSPPGATPRPFGATPVSVERENSSPGIKNPSLTPNPALQEVPPGNLGPPGARGKRGHLMEPSHIPWDKSHRTNPTSHGTNPTSHGTNPALPMGQTPPSPRALRCPSADPTALPESRGSFHPYGSIRWEIHGRGVPKAVKERIWGDLGFFFGMHTELGSVTQTLLGHSQCHQRRWEPIQRWDGAAPGGDSGDSSGARKRRMGWDGMGWDGMGWDGMGWDGMGVVPNFQAVVGIQGKELSLMSPNPGFSSQNVVWARNCWCTMEEEEDGQEEGGKGAGRVKSPFSPRICHLSVLRVTL